MRLPGCAHCDTCICWAYKGTKENKRHTLVLAALIVLSCLLVCAIALEAHGAGRRETIKRFREQCMADWQNETYAPAYRALLCDQDIRKIWGVQ